ncbi:MAG: hypothetical protein ACODAB_08240 [Gemmatimonadota bacterium]
MRAYRASIGILTVLVAACGDDDRTLPFEPEGHQPARLEYYGDPPRVSVPESVAVDEAFTISIETYGGGCIEPGPTGVKRIGDRLEIRPLDVFPAVGAVCTSDLRYIDHSVTHSATTALTLEVVIYGVRVSEAGVEDIVVTRTLMVGGG